MAHFLSTCFLLALSATVHGSPQGFNPAHPVCLGLVYTASHCKASTPSTAVTGLQLANSTGNAVLQAAGYNQRMSLDDSQIGVYDGFCSPYNLKIGPAVSGVPYRALTWSFAENGDPSWSAAYNATIHLVVVADVAIPAPFLACPSGTQGFWTLHLLTEFELPAGCVVTNLKISANGLVAA